MCEQARPSVSLPFSFASQTLRNKFRKGDALELVGPDTRPFGFEADLHPRNIIDPKRIEVKTPDVVIKVNPERADLVETKIIEGRKYIMIEVGSNIEVNGVSLSNTNE